MSSKKHTVIFGATMHTSRYAYFAAEKLYASGHPLTLLSIKKGELFGQPFLDMRSRPPIESVDTVSLYVGSRNLDEWVDYILSLKPQRIVMNPGTENFDLKDMAEARGIEVVVGCTLVMLSIDQY